MQHDNSFHLDDVRHLKEDNALRTVLGLKSYYAIRATMNNLIKEAITASKETDVKVLRRHRK